MTDTTRATRCFNRLSCAVSSFICLSTNIKLNGVTDCHKLLWGTSHFLPPNRKAAYLNNNSLSRTFCELPNRRLNLRLLVNTFVIKVYTLPIYLSTPQLIFCKRLSRVGVDTRRVQGSPQVENSCVKLKKPLILIFFLIILWQHYWCTIKWFITARNGV